MAGSVLLVEDEELVLMMLDDTLAEAGFTVLLAREAHEALTALHDHPAGFGVLVTDVNLGGPVSGWEVAAHARELNPGVGVIYLTGDSAHEWRSKGVPGSALIEKPYAPAQVVQAVASMLTLTDKS